MRQYTPKAPAGWLACAVAVLSLGACGGSADSDLDTSTASRAVAVSLEQAQTKTVRDELYSVGRLTSKNAPTLAAEINARVVEVLVEEGENIARGQELILLDTTATQLSRAEAQADIQRLMASIANEERRVARYRDLKTRDMMPQERLDDAEAKLAVDRATLVAAQARLAIAEDRLSKARLISPVNGVVEKRHVSVGDYVKVGGPLITVTDTHSLRAELPFPETVGAQLASGQRMLLTSPVAPGVELEATIGQIMPQVGMMSRALMVTAEVQNPGSWKPEATVEARVIIDSRPDAVVVPSLSIVRRPAGDVVYVLENPQDRQVRERVVEVGRRENGWIEVRSGVEAGATLVADGAFYLSDGAAIVVREQRP
jgi:RND family efflux transporter MFP subunit